jgi:hypothetical protein
MADISITGTAVKLVGGPTEDIIAGAAVAGGQLVYKEAATNKAKLSDNDSATAEVRAIRGMALHAAAADQPVRIAKNTAVVDVGAAVLTAGVDYYLSGTAGGLCPVADVTSGHDPIRAGMAQTTSHLLLDFEDPDVTL